MNKETIHTTVDFLKAKGFIPRNRDRLGTGLGQLVNHISLEAGLTILTFEFQFLQ
jgi:uncharacterized membrane protein YheB (UPF0754 family)